MKLSPTLEALLVASVHDDAFRDALLQDPVAAVEQRDHQLSPHDRAMLATVSTEQLRLVLAGLRQAADVAAAPPEPVFAPQGIRPGDHDPSSVPSEIRTGGVRGIRPGRVVLAAAAASALVGGGVAATTCVVTGVRPDPPPAVAPVSTDAATRQDAGPGPGPGRTELSGAAGAGRTAIRTKTEAADPG